MCLCTCMAASCFIALCVTCHSTRTQTIGRPLRSFTLMTDVMFGVVHFAHCGPVAANTGRTVSIKGS